MAQPTRGRRGYIVVRAKPWLRRQLDEHGALIFWRDGHDGRRVGIACAVDTCRNPGCDCRDTGLHAYEVDDLLVGVEIPARGGSTRMLFLPAPTTAPRQPSREVFAQLDLDTGELRPGMEAQDEQLLAWLRDEVDGELLDLLQRRWLIGKGEDPDKLRMVADAGEPSPGDLVSWALGHAQDRDDIYLLDGRRFLATEYYDADPAHRGADAEVVFEEVLPGKQQEPQRPLGVVRVRVRDGQDLSIAPEAPDQAVLLGRLWQAYGQRHHVAQRLTERQYRMYAVGAALTERRRSGAERKG